MIIGFSSDFFSHLQKSSAFFCSSSANRDLQNNGTPLPYYICLPFFAPALLIFEAPYLTNQLIHVPHILCYFPPSTTGYAIDRFQYSLFTLLLCSFEVIWKRTKYLRNKLYIVQKCHRFGIIRIRNQTMWLLQMTLRVPTKETKKNRPSREISPVLFNSSNGLL